MRQETLRKILVCCVCGCPDGDAGLGRWRRTALTKTSKSPVLRLCSNSKLPDSNSLEQQLVSVDSQDQDTARVEAMKQQIPRSPQRAGVSREPDAVHDPGRL